MSKRSWFGTDGIRGEYGTEPMTPSFAFRAGLAAGKYFSPEGGARFVLGRDTRGSGIPLEAALSDGLRQAGCDVLPVGVLPTAAVALVTVEEKAAAGVMVSASHNPFADNGIKFFSSTGSKLPDEAEEKIEALISQTDGAATGREDSIPDHPDFSLTEHAYSIYAKKLKGSLQEGLTLKGIHVTVDSANGASWQSTPRLLSELGAEVEALEVSPNGKNINENCGSQHPERLQKALKARGSGVGLAHDGDADRLVLIDEEGEALDGDELLAIAAAALGSRNLLKQQCLVATVMSNLGLDEAMNAKGIKVLRSAVGDRYVLELMLKEGASLGGEQSGHMLFLDHAPTGDGLLSALQIFQHMKETGRPLAELRKIMRKYPQHLINVKVREKLPLEQMPEVGAALAEVQAHLGFTGRAFLRYSGTENKVRLLLESRDGRDFDVLADKILRPLRDRIGV